MKNKEYNEGRKTEEIERKEGGRKREWEWKEKETGREGKS